MCIFLTLFRSEEVTKKVSELYEDKWEVAMIELGENGRKEKNIEFLLKILEVLIFFPVNISNLSYPYI